MLSVTDGMDLLANNIILYNFDAKDYVFSAKIAVFLQKTKQNW